MRTIQIVFCIEVSFALCVDRWATAAESSDNPYQAIVGRNVFGLKTEPARKQESPPPETPPKITVTGIVSIQELQRILIKVSRGKVGQPSTEAFYILSEGERQDGITVIRVDAKAQRVTFDNGGTLQEIDLADSPARRL